MTAVVDGRRLGHLHLGLDRPYFLAAAGSFDGPRLASIGPATSAAFREPGREPDLEADRTRPTG